MATNERVGEGLQFINLCIILGLRKSIHEIIFKSHIISGADAKIVKNSKYQKQKSCEVAAVSLEQGMKSRN